MAFHVYSHIGAVDRLKFEKLAACHMRPILVLAQSLIVWNERTSHISVGFFFFLEFMQNSRETHVRLDVHYI